MTAKEMITNAKIERLALTMLPVLILRYQELGYYPESAIEKSFRMAEAYYLGNSSNPIKSAE